MHLLYKLVLFIDNIDIRAGIELELQNLYTRLEKIKIVWMEISIEKKSKVLELYQKKWTNNRRSKEITTVLERSLSGMTTLNP